MFNHFVTIVCAEDNAIASVAFAARNATGRLLLCASVFAHSRLPSSGVAPWFCYAVLAALLYGTHQIFTRLAAERIGDGLGGFVVEASAALSILLYLGVLWFGGRWNQKFTGAGFNYSLLTGICVGAGTIAFFLLFQKGGPLSAVPAILAGGAAIMAIAGVLFFHEAPSWQRLLGIVLAIAGLFLLRR
jgi:transporter family protein